MEEKLIEFEIARKEYIKKSILTNVVVALLAVIASVLLFLILKDFKYLSFLLVLFVGFIQYKTTKRKNEIESEKLKTKLINEFLKNNFVGTSIDKEKRIFKGDLNKLRFFKEAELIKTDYVLQFKHKNKEIMMTELKVYDENKKVPFFDGIMIESEFRSDFKDEIKIATKKFPLREMDSYFKKTSVSSVFLDNNYDIFATNQEQKDSFLDRRLVGKLVFFKKKINNLGFYFKKDRIYIFIDNKKGLLDGNVTKAIDLETEKEIKDNFNVITEIIDVI